MHRCFKKNLLSNNIIKEEKRDKVEMKFLFSFPQKEKKQQILIATNDAHSCVLARLIKLRSIFYEPLINLYICSYGK